MRTLDFTKEKVQLLSLEELEQTYHENLVDGTPVNGIYHFVLVQKVLEIFEQAGLRPDVQEIFAANNRDSMRPGVTVLPAIEERDGKGAISAHLLRRVYANIALRESENDEVVTNLAIAYHQKGIQLAIGPMVKVCHNQCILGRPDVVANYGCMNGDERLSTDKRLIDYLLLVATNWAQNFVEKEQLRIEKVQILKELEFTRDTFLRFIGLLLEKRIIKDSNNNLIHRNEVYPLNSAQINEVAENLLIMLNHPMTWWHAYQELNFVLKPDRMDIPSVIPQSVALIETINEFLS